MKKELVCKYCKNEFCVNDQCPLVADYCPVPDTPGVCKHEVRVQASLNLQECLVAAFEDCGQPITPKEVEEIFDSFVSIMAENGFMIIHESERKDHQLDFSTAKQPEVHQTPYEPKKYVPGMTVNIYEIANCDDWVFDRKIGDGRDAHETIIYVTRDRTMTVSFYDGLDGTIMLNKAEEEKAKFYLGQEIHFEDIMASDEWIYQRVIGNDEGSPEMCYITKDGKFAVSFDRDKIENNGVGVVMMRKQNDESKYSVGQELSVDDVSKDTRHWKLWRISPDPFNTACAYMNHDHTMIVRFEHGEERGVVSEFDEFQVGDKVHISTVEASDKWVYAGELYGLRRYVTKDEIRRVAFPMNYDWGTVMLNQ
jgi:hypothetical protein